MHSHTQTSKRHDAKKNAAEYEKPVKQDQNTSPKENTPAFTKSEPAKVAEKPLLEAAKGNDELMSLPPQTEKSPKTQTEPAADKPIPKETAQEAVHQVMPKIEAKKIEAEVAASTAVKKTPGKDDAKKVQP